MKILALTSVIIFCVSNLFAQGIPVSHSVEKKKIVLEVLGGMRCTYCPDGDKIADQLEAAHPGNFFLINIHAGQYAEPGVGDPDFTTSVGDYIDAQAGSTSNPAGSINRHVFPAYSHTPGKTAMGRTYWTTATNQIIAQNAIANIGIEASIDIQSKLLSVDVQAYYTSAPATSSHRMHVLLIQNNIEGPQIGSGFYPELVLPNGNYNHQHVLRASLTGVTGKLISVGLGVTVDETFSFPIPDDINGLTVNMQNLEVVAFITEQTYQEVVNVQAVKPEFTNFPAADNSKVLEVKVTNNAVCGFTTSPIVKIQNFGSQPLTSLYLDYSINNSPLKTYYWTGNLSPISSQEITLNDINFFPESSNELTVTARLPNGNSDGDNSDNQMAATFPSAPDANNTIYMTLNLDNYGAEVTWELVNSDDTELYSGGPYANSNPATKRDTFNLSSGDCYEFRVHDSETDGILGTGKGFTLQDDNGVSLLLNFATYGSGATVPFGVDAPQPDSSDVFTSIISPDLAGRLQVYPNPASGTINVNLPPMQTADMNIYITNTLGQILMSAIEKQKTVQSTIQIDAAGLSPGIYFMNVVAGEKRFSEKIVITF